ncbi:MAG: hypothetical protein IID63_08105 [candidate division Zixibacteria bacterium]|nr:hypothetical protein [candidate division Zixibacteria bacterium]
MKTWRFNLRTCAIILIVIALAPVVSGQSYNRHDESFLLYISAGPSLPTGSSGDSIELGFHVAVGFGVVLSSGSQLSPELNLRYIYSRLALTELKSQWSADNLIKHLEQSYFGLEMRFRIQNQRRLRPYFTLGVGLTAEPRNIFPDQAFILGGGIDLATNGDGFRLLYGELRLISSTRSYMLLSIGFRLG